MAWLMPYVPWGLAALSILANVWLAFRNSHRTRIDKRFGDHESRLNEHDERIGALRETVGELRGSIQAGRQTEPAASDRRRIVLSATPHG